QLGEEPGLTLARVRGLGALLAEPALRLLEVALLVAELPAVAPLGEGGRRRRQNHRDQRRGDRAPPHGWARPRARRPPIAPSAAPVAMSRNIWGIERKTARWSPSVRGRSGSSRGAAPAYAASSTASAMTAAISPWVMPWSTRGRRITVSVAPTRRMI